MINTYFMQRSTAQWALLAAVLFGTGCLGAIMFLAWGWTHVLAALSFYAGAAGAVVAGGQAVAQYKQEIETSDSATAEHHLGKGAFTGE